MSKPNLSIVAILRGITPGEIVDVAAALVRSGIRTIEVPLNSPDPFESIARLHTAFGEQCLCGAGTVLTTAQVEQVRAAGGQLVVSPNTDPALIARALELRLTPMPGFASATEAFQAIAAGASDLKLFPASSYGPGHLRALRAVLPAATRVYAVGGIDERNLAQWLAAGADGVGLGGNLYQPGMRANEVGARADAFIAAIAAHHQSLRGAVQ